MLGFVLLASASCAKASETAPPGATFASIAAPAPMRVDVSCAGGQIEVSAPEVFAGPDGVHLKIHDLGGLMLRAELDGSIVDGIQAGSRASRFQWPPGKYRLSCVDDSNKDHSGAQLEILDPGDWYQSPTLGCDCACWWIFGVPHWERDPIGSIRDHLDLLPEDRIEPRGYERLSMATERDESGWFVVIRGDKVIAKMQLTNGENGGSLAACTDVLPETAGTHW